MIPLQSWDEAPGAYARNLARELIGQTVDCDPDPEAGHAGGTFTIADIAAFAVGIDSHGIFACVTVRDPDGRKYDLYSSGHVEDAETGATIGRHEIVWQPAAKAVH